MKEQLAKQQQQQQQKHQQQQLLVYSHSISRKRCFKCRPCWAGKAASLWSIRIFLAWLLLCLLPMFSIWTTIHTTTWSDQTNATIDLPILPVSLLIRKQNQNSSIEVEQYEQREIFLDNATTTTVTNLTSTAEKRNEGPNLNSSISINASKYLDFYLGARFPDGTLGYVADPTALARGRLQYLKQQSQQQKQQQLPTKHSVNSYWKVLEGYQWQARNGTETGDWILGSDYVCAVGPGRGFEEDGGYKLLAEKVRIRGIDEDEEQDHQNDRKSSHQTFRSPKDNKQAPGGNRPVRILCAMYTYPRMRDLFRVQALSWGYKCDGFLAFSTETIPELGLVDLIHEGPESYMNMWQKVRSIWIYLYHHYGRDYDFFHLGGDDLYVIVENFRPFLQTVRDTASVATPIFLGQWIPLPGTSKDEKGRYYVAGAPGYTLNQRALQLFVEQAIPTCHVQVQASFEDRLISKCMRDLNIWGQDTRDRETGEQQYHDCSPHHLYTAVSQGRRGSFHSRLMTYWEVLPHPTYPNTTTGPKHGLEGTTKYSINFHNLYHPLYAARIHAMLYKHTCPADSALGRGLRAHLRL